MVSSYDHEIEIDGIKKGLTLVRDDKDAAMYSVSEEVPRYDPQLKLLMKNWVGGHGQYEFLLPEAYFDGQSIDTTQDGKIMLGPLITTVGISGGTPALDGNPVCFCWFSAISKLLVATATQIYWYDGTNWVAKWQRGNHAWANSHTWTVTTDWVYPTVYNGYVYQCTTGGSGASSEPTWGLIPGGTTTSSNAIFTCRGAIQDMVEYNGKLFVACGSSDTYYYSADCVTFTASTLTDHHADGFFTSPNAAGTANVLWKFSIPNEVKSAGTALNGATSTDDWSSVAYVGDSSNNITKIFLINDNLMIGRTDNLYHYDSDGGVHALMDDLKANKSTNNFKYATTWQTCIYFSLGTGMGEIASYNAYDPMGPLSKIGDIGKAGACVGLAADKDWLYVAMDEGTNTHVYKGREIKRGDALRWEWCPWVFIGTNAIATMQVVQHSATDRRLWFGYGTQTGYVILT
ncbi:MAG: hypothetical protein IMZ61_12380, partial [Planctomycetes bacterium]|nr:hypothetical protein [Planctomycetota bacterium]